MTASTRGGRGRGLLFAGLVLLLIQQLVVGLWALLAPVAFFADVPTVAVMAPYNEHLVRDFGAATLATVPLLVAATVRRGALLSSLALVSVLVFAVPHAVFHAVVAPTSSSTDGGPLVALGFAASVLLPGALLVVPLREAVRRRCDRAQEPT